MSMMSIVSVVSRVSGISFCLMIIVIGLFFELIGFLFLKNSLRKCLWKFVMMNLISVMKKKLLCSRGVVGWSWCYFLLVRFFGVMVCGGCFVVVVIVWFGVFWLV